jgi:hypothetical protein
MRSAIGPFFLVLALQQLGASGGVVAAASGSTGLRDGALPSEPTSAAIAVSTPHTGVSSISSGSSSGSASSSSSSSTASLLAFINGLSGQSRHILSGQHSNYWDSNPLDVVTPIPTATGKQVAILGTSNFWLNSDGKTSSTGPWFVSTTNAWLAKGGLVLVTQEPIVPWSSGEAVTDTYTAGTNANKNWNAYLNSQVALFKQINGAVMWRPFPEPNGGSHFGSQFTPAQFVTFWQYTYNYMKAQGLSNVLWVFNLNYWDARNGATKFSGGDWYPGAGYVDIVSVDSYPPDSNSTLTYNWMVTTGKPIMFAEAGVNGSNTANSGNNDTGVLNAVKSGFPKAFAIVIWCQNWALPLQGGESAFMNDPAIITLSDVPAAFLNGSSTSP